MGLPRHASQHPGGMVISTRPLIDVCPVVPAAMEGRQIVQWDKDSCADAGFLKIDLLGLGMLSAVERCVEEIGRDPRRAARPLAHPARRRPRPTSRSAPPRPPASSRSRAAPRCRCCRAPCRANLDDLTVQVALVRPGPDPGRRRPPLHRAAQALREDPAYEVPYEHPLLEPVLEETLGVDRLPGAGDRGGDGARRLQLRGGRGAAAGDEPQALRGGDRARTTSASSRAPSSNGVAAGDRRAGLRPDRGLLGLRLPEGALGRLRPARLPVGLAAGPPRPGVPLRAAQRAADGLLPARRARPRGAAARHPGRRARRQPQPRPLPRRSRARAARRARRADRPRLREGRARGGDGGAGRRARARRPLRGHRRRSPRAPAPGARASNGSPGPGRSTGSRPTRRASGARRSGRLGVTGGRRG